MSAEPAIAAALRSGAQLWCDGAALRFSAPAGADLSWREEIARHRDDVRALLGDDRLAPASAAQEELWTADGLGRGATYAMPLAFRVHGRLDAGRLQHALDVLVQRHAALRTTFEAIGDRPAQRIAPRARIKVERSADPVRALHDLRRGPLLHVRIEEADAHSRLSLNLHHIAGDWQSLGTLVTELAALYEGRELTPAPAATCAEFAAAERVLPTDDARRYWRDTLRDAPAVLSLTRDFPPRDTDDTRGARLVRPFEDPIAASTRATPFMTHLALFAALLARHARQEELLIGCPFSTRRDGDEGVIGLFVNMLPMRIRVARRARIADLIEQIRESVLAAHEHRHLPFAEIASSAGRAGAARPLLQATFDHQEPLRVPRAIGGMAMQRVSIPIETAKFDLSLTVTRSDITWEYAAAAFRASSIETLAAEHRRLIEAFAADDGAAVDAVAGTPPNPRVKREAPRLLDVLTRRASERPHSIAVESAEEAVSYPELLRRAQCIAHALSARGIGAEERVGVLIERSADQVVAACGVLLSGAAYLPLETAAPAEVLAGTLAAASARLVLTGRGGGALPGGIAALDVREAIAQGTRAPLVAPPRESLAYVIRTSGTTGTPKCVGVSHGSLDAFLASITACYDWSPADRVLLFTNPAFDASIEEVLGALYSGSALVAHGPALLAPSDIVDLAVSRGITALDLTTAYWHNFADWLVSAGVSLPPSLRMVTVGGGKMSAAAVQSWLWAAPHVRLVNAYGPTETTVTCLATDVAATDGGEVSIGTPIDGATAVVVD
ncbi:MAG TPA: AMP-binding protein, partial [Thermoanaerobaculia bacterium]|nr:AMP-binding protein [Thermoanaerobaculia bacterium]